MKDPQQTADELVEMYLPLFSRSRPMVYGARRGTNENLQAKATQCAILHTQGIIDSNPMVYEKLMYRAPSNLPSGNWVSNTPFWEQVLTRLKTRL